MKNVVSFLGSPRRNGNTETLLNAALAAAKKEGAEVPPAFRLSEMKINPCIECGGCDGTGICVVHDDFQVIYKALKEENLFILASPVFFMGSTGWTKAMIDRCQSCWAGKYKAGKPIAPPSPERRGIFLSVCGMKDFNVFDCAVKEVKAFFAVNNIELAGNVLVPDTDRKGAISENMEALARAEDMARELLKSDSVPGDLPGGHSCPG
ncbi:MAG: flavodoxin family protein [Chloroflexi bacterium]|nr:flavodoxin family protein [Chloroflexota bacterium]